jgi:Mn-dependent DtxR family transcriptional regulator
MGKTCWESTAQGSQNLAEKGLVNFSGGKVRLTPRGFLLGNLVFSECVDCGDSAQS